MLQGIKRVILLASICLVLIALSITPDNEGGKVAFPAQGLGANPPMESGLKPAAGEASQAQKPDPRGILAENLTPEDGGRLNILLLGIDARSSETSRSDSMMVVSMNPQDYSAAVLSVLRDSYVNIPSPQPVRNRINAAYALGGPSLALRTVSNFLQIPIKYYIVMDFAGFEKVVDAIGGVKLEVEKRMDYVDDGKNDIHLLPGEQNLNGHQALGYARFRHDVQGDYARVERQRKLLKAIKEKIQGVQAIYYLPKLVDAVKPYIQSNLDFSGLAGLAYFGYRLNEVTNYTVPSPHAHSEENIAGMSVLVPNLVKTRLEVQRELGGGS